MAEDIEIPFSVCGRTYTCELKNIAKSSFLLEKVFSSYGGLIPRLDVDSVKLDDVGPVEFEHVLSHLKDERYTIPQEYIYQKYGLGTIKKITVGTISLKDTKTLSQLNLSHTLGYIYARDFDSQRVSLQFGFRADKNIVKCSIKLNKQEFALTEGNLMTIEWNKLSSDGRILVESDECIINPSDYYYMTPTLYYFVRYE